MAGGAEATRRVAAAAIAVMLGLAGCTGGAGPSGSPAGSMAADTGASPVSASPDATGAGSTWDGLPAGWSYLYLDDPALRLGIPADWTVETPPATTDPEVMAGLTGDERRNAEAWDADVLQGNVRSLASGTLPQLGGTTFDADVVVYVESGDRSLEEAIQRDVDVTSNLIPGVALSRGEAQTPLGPAATLTYSGRVGDDEPFVSMDYVLLLDDGRTLTIVFTGWGDVARPDAITRFAAQAISTLARSGYAVR